MRKLAVIICRLALAAIFLLASIPKIIAPQEFALAIFRYQLLPDAAINLMAIFLPWVELVAAIAILLPSTSDGAAALLFGLLAVFTAAIAINLIRGIDISCGCFTLDPDAGPIGWWEVARDVGFLAMAGFVLWGTEDGKRKTENGRI